MIIEVLDGKEKKNATVHFEEESFCEHCYKLEQFDAIICVDDGCGYCVYCINSNYTIKNSDKKKISKIEKEHKKTFFQKRLEELNDY